MYENYQQATFVLRPTRQKTGHFADVLPSKSLGSTLLVLEKLN